MRRDVSSCGKHTSPNQRYNFAHSQRRQSRWLLLFAFTTTSHLVILLPAVLLSICVAAESPVQTIFFGRFFEAFSAFGAGSIDADVFTHRALETIYPLIAIAGLAWLLRGFHSCLWLVNGELQTRTVRHVIFEVLLRGDIEQSKSANLEVQGPAVRLQAQIHELQMGTSQPLGTTCSHTAETLISLGIAFFYNWRLTLFIIAGVSVILCILALISVDTQGRIERYHTDLGTMTSVVDNTISNMATVKCCNGQPHELRLYVRTVKQATLSYLKLVQINATQNGFMRFATSAVVVGAMFYGGYLIHHGTSTTARVTTALFSCTRVLKALQDAVSNLSTIDKGRAAAKELYNITRPAESSPVSCQTRFAVPSFTIHGKVEFHNVSSSYPLTPDHTVLHSSTMVFHAGECTFLVGSSGSGKSTLGDLLLKFQQPLTGSIKIDDTDIWEIDTSWLRNNITLVQQDSQVFNETLFRNVAFGRGQHAQVSGAEIEVCLKFSLLSELISQLPHGVQTRVGCAGGSILSGGQIQKIAIARARLRDSAILILDECTSALDLATRRVITNNIRQWRAGKTTIIITHDLTQINEDDFVYKLDKGKIIAQGYLRDLGNILEVTKRSLKANSSAEKHIPNLAKRNSSSLDSVDVLTPAQHFGSRLSLAATVLLGGMKSRSTVSLRDYSLRSHDSYSLHTDQVSRLSDCTTRLTSLHDRIVSRPSNRLSEIVEGRYPERTAKPPAKVGSPVIKDLDQTSSSGCWTLDIPPEPLSVYNILTSIWPQLSVRHRLYFVSGMLAAVVQAACLPCHSYILVKLFNTWSLTHGWQAEARLASLTSLGIATANGLAAFIMILLFETCGQAWIGCVRTKAFKGVMGQPLTWLEIEQSSLDLISSVLENGAEEMRDLLGQLFGPIVIVLIMITVATVWSFVICWKVTLVCVSSLPVLYSVMTCSELVFSHWERKSNSASDSVHAVFAEALSNISTVRALTLESYFHKKHAIQTNRAFRIGLLRSFYSGLLSGLADSVLCLTTAAIFAYGTSLAKSGAFSPQSIFTVFTILIFSTTNSSSLIAHVPRISSSVESANRIHRLTTSSSRSYECVGNIEIDEHALHLSKRPVQFTDLTFYYPSRPGVPALDGLRLCISPNICTAIVGASGSGKSTIASLLLGLYPVPSNSNSNIPPLTVFNHDIRTLKLPTLRSQIAVVPQFPRIFSCTVRENILYGQIILSKTTEHNLQLAAKAAGIHEFIETLPQGYSTLIGDKHRNVSGGQAQRIAIARALVRHPKILILDEPTSALDTATADTIRKTIAELVRPTSQTSLIPDHKRRARMTVILITHSKEMMECADHIAVMKNGRVVEEGEYHDLLRAQGELWRILNDEDGDESAVAGPSRA